MQCNSTAKVFLFSPKFAATLAWWERLDRFTRRRSPDLTFEVQSEQLSDCRFCLAPVMPIFDAGQITELDVTADDQGMIHAESDQGSLLSFLSRVERPTEEAVTTLFLHSFSRSPPCRRRRLGSWNAKLIEKPRNRTTKDKTTRT